VTNCHDINALFHSLFRRRFLVLMATGLPSDFVILYYMLSP